ncbi:nucleoside deaminase [Nocardioides sp. B-3]|uniref:nucleoside deaminase n=1 Tax=Nocardioides sp. B-3 TaxID=2895565 RepID=UPI002153691C|nr:nucleoside deaminase [Nocardioides sp. B-3]UUZ58650.1 nucleoside deaminase [Nocardioides sp. B-3]
MVRVITPEDAVALALDVAKSGLAAGEMPIGAVVLSGELVLGKAFTQERTLGRRIVHADLIALEQADAMLGFARTEEPLVLAVNPEPCIMCLGAAVTLGVERVYYALESPNDGGVDLLAKWHPPVEQPFFSKPTDIRSGFHRTRSQQLFRHYADGSGPAGMRRWAAGLAGL